MSTGALALSSLFVLASALVVPAWRNKHRESEHANVVRVLSILTLSAAVVATVWLTLQVISLGVHDTAPQSHSTGSSLGSLFGIPVIVIPLAILIAAVGVVELLVRPEHTASSGPYAGALTASSPEASVGAGGGGDAGGGGWFSRRANRDERALEEIRGELTDGGVNSRAVLADALAQIESWWSVDLEERARIEVSTQAAVEVLQDSVAESTADVNRAMQGVAQACATVNARIEAHRRERPGLVEAIALLARPAPARVMPRDGSISAAPSEIVPAPERTAESAQDAEISIIEPDEISIVDDHEHIRNDDDRDHEPVPVPAPAAAAPSYEPWREIRSPAAGTLATSVKRLRARAQSAGWQVWTRAPGRGPAATVNRTEVNSGSDPTWDFQNPASKHRMLSAIRRETDDLFTLASEPANWHAPTACTGWEVRDMVGHLVDATESYLVGFDVARGSGAAPGSVGVTGMAAATDDAALAFRAVPREELLGRFRDDTDRLMQAFESVTEAEWTSLLIADRYLGPLPVMIVVAGLLAGSAVHAWDVREGLGAPHAVAADVADLLVPFVFLFWWATANTATVEAPYAIGIRTSGRNGGDTRIEVSAAGLVSAPASIDDCPAILEFDPASFVLTAYNRVNSGTVHGDRNLAAEFRSLFVSI